MKTAVPGSSGAVLSGVTELAPSRQDEDDLFLSVVLMRRRVRAGRKGRQPEGEIPAVAVLWAEQVEPVPARQMENFTFFFVRRLRTSATPLAAARSPLRNDHPIWITYGALQVRAPG